MPSLQPIWVENPEEEPKTTLYARITNSDTPPLYDDIMNSDLSKEDKVKQIQYRTQAYQDDLDKQLNKDLARMKAGTALSAASFHPFFNVPYVGTGIGGAMYDLGQGIVEGDTAGDLAKRAGRGFVIGETIGAIPYAGKALGKTKAGQAVINSAPVQAVGGALNKAGEKFANSKLYDTLMTDFAPMQTIERKVILPTVRKINAGINPFTRSESMILADTPNTGTEAFKTWSANKPLVTSEEALNYPFKTGEGVTLEGFHGTQRGDRIGSEFRKDRATSGPMAYFSSDKDIASGYAKSKVDTSLADEMSDYKQWFKYKDKNGKIKPLGEAFWDMPYEERQAIRTNAPHITFDDEANEIIFDANNNRGIGNYDYAIKQYRDNPLKALIDGWLEGGSLYGREDDFLKVLEKSGVNMKNIEYIDPYTDHSKVYDVYLSMKNPLVTDDIPNTLFEKLTAEAPKHPAKYQEYGDIWDKNTKDGVEWVKELGEDIANGENSHVWTSIPDWVSDEIKNAGYDGIIDIGGKGGGQIHKVYIPFEPTQIKSKANEGTWSLTNPNIYKSIIGALGSYQLYNQLNNDNLYNQITH